MSVESNTISLGKISISKQVVKIERQITAARFKLTANVLPLVTGSLPFAELARRCLIRNRGFYNEHSEVITGKTSGGKPLLGHRHAHYLPTDEDGDGRIDHLTIYAAQGFGRDEIEAISEMSSINWRESRTGIRLILTDLGNSSDFASGRNESTLFRQSLKFRSVTPFSLPNFPNRGGGKPPRPKDLPEGQLKKELKTRGLPTPIRIDRIDGYETENKTKMRWLEFHAERLRKQGMRGKGLYGFEIEFAEEITGPISVGFGSHFGLGLFLPVK